MGSVETPCQADPDYWFSESGAQVARAKRLCQPCPLLEECRERGLGEEFGVWGGLSAGDRERLEKRPTLVQQEKERQREVVLELVRSGYGTAEIAAELNVNVRTVQRIRAAAA